MRVAYSMYCKSEQQHLLLSDLFFMHSYMTEQNGINSVTLFYMRHEIKVNVSGWADCQGGKLWLSRDPLAGVHNASSLPAPLDTKEPLI